MAYPLACPSLPPSFICFICFFSLISVARAQEESLLPGELSSRSPHGPAYQAPAVALSPAAFEFFHPAFSPSAARNGAESTGGGPPPLASAGDVAEGARGSTVHEKVWPTRKDVGGGGRAEAGRVAAVLLGAVSAVLFASGVYCVLSRRRGRAHKTSATLLVV